jgi:hypothetical protein
VLCSRSLLPFEQLGRDAIQREGRAGGLVDQFGDRVRLAQLLQYLLRDRSGRVVLVSKRSMRLRIALI